MAASMLMLSGWRREEALLDPMCGGGTIPIEAALIELRIPPGARRLHELAVSRLKFVNKERIREIAEELEAETDLEFKPRIIGSDASPKSIRGPIKLVGDVLRLGEWLDDRPGMS